MIVRDEVTGEYLNIKCDVESCQTVSPPAEELIKHHGLVNMGWYCSGGRHLCPEHYPTEANEGA